MQNPIFILIIWMFSLSNISVAQIVFQKGYKVIDNGWGTSIQQTTDDGYIITGLTYLPTPINNHDAFLLKTDSLGDTLWTKTYGGFQTDRGHGVQQTYDGGYIIGGLTLNAGGFKETPFLIKTDSLGDTLWIKRYNAVTDFFAYTVQQTKDTGYILCGGNSDLIKTDADGNVLWAKEYGGPIAEIGHSAQQTSDGGYIVTGLTDNFGATNANVHLVKTDSIGNPLWAKMYDAGLAERPESVQQTSDGGFIINCWTWNLNGLLIKTDSIGNLLWSKQYDGTGALGFFTASQTFDGGYILSAGHSSYGAGDGDAYLIKFDSIGNLVWSKVFDVSGPDEISSAIQTKDGGYIATGYAQITFGSFYIYLIKTDSNGVSGCNEMNAPTIVSSPVTTVSSVSSVVTNLIITVDNPGYAVNSGGIVTDLCTVGINEPLKHYSISISPNPSYGVFTISSTDNFIDGEIDIFNLLGNKIYSDKLNANSKKKIHLENIATGIYFVKIFDGVNSCFTKLIIEQN